MEPDQPSLTVPARTEPRRGRFGRSKFGQAYRDRVPGIVAAVTSITGVLNLLVALMPRERHRLHQLHEVLPVALSAGAVAIVAVSGLLLWRLGTMLRRRKWLEPSAFEHTHISGSRELIRPPLCRW
jgi:hypothetical protein